MLPHKILRTTYNKMSYFGFYFDWKSTYNHSISISLWRQLIGSKLDFKNSNGMKVSPASTEKADHAIHPNIATEWE